MDSPGSSEGRIEACAKLAEAIISAGYETHAEWDEQVADLSCIIERSGAFSEAPSGRRIEGWAKERADHDGFLFPWLFAEGDPEAEFDGMPVSERADTVPATLILRAPAPPPTSEG